MKLTLPKDPIRKRVRQDAKHVLAKASDQEIDVYVNSQITNLADAKTLFKQILKTQRNILQRLNELS